MESKIIYVILCAVFAAASASMVNLTSEWKPDSGWEVTCAWTLVANDSLQSVRLSENERQFLIYRPEVHGPVLRRLFQLPNKDFEVRCGQNSDRGVTGQCVMTMGLFQPVTDDMRYSCEVSGERPFFREEKVDLQIAALVPPSAAVIKVVQTDALGLRAVLNCTSHGLPAPNLVWSIGEQRVPQDFSGKTWNVTSKLWHSWSLLSHTSSETSANCTPEVSQGGQTVKGASAEYSAGIGSRSSISLVLGVISILASTASELLK